MNIANLLARTGKACADMPALWLGAELICDYRTLRNHVAALSGHLRLNRGIKPGDRVVIFSANVPEYLVAQQAIYWLGGVTVPVNAKLHARELGHIIEDATPSLVFVSDDLLETVKTAGIPDSDVVVLGSAEYLQAIVGPPAEMETRKPDDLASLFYTSGTTGRPKGVMQTNRNLLSMTACYFTDVDDVQPVDAMIYAAPFSHGAGLYHFAFILKGASHVFPVSKGFEPAEIVDLSKSFGRLCMFAAPTMVRRLVDFVRTSGSDVSGIKTIVYGGGPMYFDDLREALDMFGPRLVQIYGQGESPMTITALSKEVLNRKDAPRWEEKAMSVGISQALVEVATVGEDGRFMEPGQSGEIVVRGDTVMAGYWNNPEATSTTLRNGWLYTGDIGVMDSEGYLTLKDRSKDLIISGGSNIYPREVEEVLLLHPAVSEAAVVGQRDTEWGEIPIAFLAFKRDCSLTPGELDTWCVDHLARFKRPKGYRFVEALPKNNYGKVVKTVLRDWLSGESK